MSIRESCAQESAIAAGTSEDRADGAIIDIGWVTFRNIQAVPPRFIGYDCVCMYHVTLAADA